MEGRSCTDMLCCLIFTAFLVVMIGISGYALTTGDPVTLATPFDSDGNQCGQLNQGKSNITAADGTIIAWTRDFTPYKYKYFSQLLQATTGNTEKIYNALCVSECPVNVPAPGDFTKSFKVKCIVNNDEKSCPTALYNTTLVFGYCLPEYDSTVELIKTVFAEMNNQANFSQYFIEIGEVWKLMIVMCFVALILSVIYVFLLRWIAKPLIYVSLFAIFLLGLLGGYWVWMKREDFLEGTDNYKHTTGAAIAIWAITAVYTFFVCC